MGSWMGPHAGEQLRYSEMRHVCTSWARCCTSSLSQHQNEGLNSNWWFILVQLSCQPCSHVILVFSLWLLLAKFCHPLMRMGCRCLARTCTAACDPQNKHSQLGSAEQSVLPDSGGITLATDKSKPANLCWDTHRHTEMKCIELRLAIIEATIWSRGVLWPTVRPLSDQAGVELWRGVRG